MPLYEYQCDSCGARFELIRKFSDPPLTVCPKCGKETVQKLISAPAFQFKGSGFYITDYAKKSDDSSASTASAKAKAEAKADAKSDGKGGDKSESKSESKSEAPKDSGSTSAEKSGGDKPAAATPAPAAPAKDKS